MVQYKFAFDDIEADSKGEAMGEAYSYVQPSLSHELDAEVENQPLESGRTHTMVDGAEKDKDVYRANGRVTVAESDLMKKLLEEDGDTVDSLVKQKSNLSNVSVYGDASSGDVSLSGEVELMEEGDLMVKSVEQEVADSVDLHGSVTETEVVRSDGLWYTVRVTFDVIADDIISELSDDRLISLLDLGERTSDFEVASR